MISKIHCKLHYGGEENDNDLDQFYDYRYYVVSCITSLVWFSLVYFFNFLFVMSGMTGMFIIIVIDIIVGQLHGRKWDADTKSRCEY